ncbi:MAG: hypothetical protein IJ544_03635 [Prevotella sp.]|nr:hypothetical protein [Prevotella sp.]
MKKYLLKSLLLLVALLGGTSAWAAEINATLDHTAGAQWGSNTGASTVDAEKEHYNNDAASGWSGCAYAKFSFEIPSGNSITKATLKYSVNQGGRAGRNDIIYYMSKDFDLDWANFAGQTGTDLRNAASRAGKAVAAAATGGTGDRLNLSQDVTDAVRALFAEGQSYVIFQWTGNAGGADLYGKASENAPTLTIETADASALTTYTIKFTDGTKDLKDPVVYEGVTIGAEVTASAEDMASFTVDEKKYIYQSGNTTLTTVADATANVISLVFREAAVVNYTLTESTTGETLTSGKGFEGDAVSAYYPHYILKDNILYECPKQGSNPWYGISITLGSSDASETITYTATEIGNIVYVSEGEAIEGATKNSGNYADIRSFGGTVGFAPTDIVITNLPAGKYKIKADLFTPTSAMGSQKIKIGEQEFTLTSTANGYHNELETEEFTLTAATDVTWVAGGSNTNAIDWLYIQKTGDYVDPLATEKADLQETIDLAKTISTEGKTEASVTALTAAIAAAEAALAAADATAESLTAARYALKEAIDGLEDDVPAVVEGTFFSANVVATANVAFAPGTTEITSEQATVVGGKITAISEQTADKNLIGKQGSNYLFCMTNNNTYFKVDLDNALAVGDTIAAKTYTRTDTNLGLFISTETSRPNETTTKLSVDAKETAAYEDLSNYVVAEGDGLVGAKTIYIYRETGKSTYFNEFKITRKAAEENFEFVDCTAKVDANGWKSDIGSVGNYTKDVAQKEQYLTNTTTLGQVLYQTVEGLDNGTYTVELYANASYTSGRGFTSAALNNEVGRAIVYAGDVEKTIPVVHQTAVGENNIVTLENVVVSDGTLKMGLRKDIEGSNWHTIQIKALTQTSDKAKADAAAQDEYWKGIAATVAAYEAYVNVAGAEKAAIAAAETKAAAQAAIAPFYAAKASYDNLVQAIADADAAGVDAGDAKAVLADAKTTAEKATEAYHAVKLAINTKAVEGASASNPIVTNFVVNGTFDTAGNIAPWKTTGGFQNQTTATNQQGAFTVPFFENWNGSAKANKMYQEIEDIPNGNYTLKIAAFVNTFDAATQYVFANADHVALTSGDPTAYEVNTIVTNNKIEIGLEQTAAVANWMGIDNVSLVYTGETNIEELVAAYDEALKAAKAVEGKMNTEAKTALDAAIAAEVDKTNAKALAEATAALQEATSAAKASAAAYASANAAIEKAKAILNGTNVATAAAKTAFEEAIAAIATPYENGTLTNDAANAAGTTLGTVVTGWRAGANGAAVKYMESAYSVIDAFNNPLYVNTWSVEGDQDGSNFSVPFYEYFTDAANALGAKTFTTTVSGLEPGNYEVSAWVRVQLKNGETAPAGVTIDANGGEAVEAIGTEATSQKMYLKETTATGVVGDDGILNININVVEGNNIHWLSFKNVKFEKKGPQYTVNEKVGDEIVRTTTGTAELNTTVKVPYRHYNVVDGKLYSKGVTSKEYNYSFTFTADGQVENITGYTATGAQDIVFLSEGEDIEGLTPCTSANTAIRSSNSASAYAAEADVEIVKLPAGTYKLTAAIYDSAKTPNSMWYFIAGTDTIAKLNCTNVNYQELSSDKFTLEAETSILLAKGGSNTQGLDLVYIQKVEAETPVYAYTVNEKVGDEILRTTTGTADKASVVKVAYRHYNVLDGKLYSKGVTNKEYNYSFTLNENNQVENIVYDATEIENVVFLKEGEDIEGLTKITTGNSAIRSSNSAAGYAAEADVEIVKLPAGIYKLTAALYDSAKTPDSHFIFKAGETQVADLNCTNVNYQELSSDEFTLTAETAILLAKGGSATQGLDLVYIVKVGDIDTGINTLKAEIENGSVYNLNGQKVQKAQKGLYIINGKKVVVK